MSKYPLNHEADGEGKVTGIGEGEGNVIGEGKYMGDSDGEGLKLGEILGLGLDKDWDGVGDFLGVLVGADEFLIRDGSGVGVEV